MPPHEQKLSNFRDAEVSTSPLFWITSARSVRNMIRQGYDQINEIVLRGDNSYRAKESEKQWSKLLPRPLSSWLNLTSNWEFHTQEDWDVTLFPTNTRLPSKDMLDRAEWISVCTEA